MSDSENKQTEPTSSAPAQDPAATPLPESPKPMSKLEVGLLIAVPAILVLAFAVYTLRGSNEIPESSQRLRIANCIPAPDDTKGAVIVTFNHSVTAAEVNVNTLRILAAGGDNSFHEGNEKAIAPVAVKLIGAQKARVEIPPKLPADTYKVALVPASSKNTAATPKP